MSDEVQKLRIHFASGKTVDVILGEDEAADATEVEAFIEEVIRGGQHPIGHSTKPCWTWLGDVYLYTQTVEGVEIL